VHGGRTTRQLNALTVVKANSRYSKPLKVTQRQYSIKYKRNTGLPHANPHLYTQLIAKYTNKALIHAKLLLVTLVT